MLRTSCAAFLLLGSFMGLLSCAFTNFVDSDGKTRDSTSEVRTEGVEDLTRGRVNVPRAQPRTPGQKALPDNLKVAAFNVQVFGVKKMSDPKSASVLVKILSRYDVILVQEIRDSSNTAIWNLVGKLNSFSGKTYKVNISPRLGRTNNKEQYAFLYRADRLTVKRSYVYDDGDEVAGNDTFEREPYVVMFGSSITHLKTFTFVGIHTKPTKAVSEVDQLAAVYDDVVKHLGTNDVIIMGDFNAACSYVSDKDWKSMRLATDKRFHWLISDCVDTTVAGSLCAYDRFVVAGHAMLASIVPRSAKTFMFDREFHLTESKSLDVSDHYPIELQLSSSALATANSQVEQRLKYSFKSPTAVNKNTALRLRHKTNPLLKMGFTVRATYKKSGGTIGILLKKRVDSQAEALQLIQKCRNHWPTLISESQVIATAAKLSEIITDQGVQAWLQLQCDLQLSTHCWISLELVV